MPSALLWLQRLRLVSGLALLLFVFSHLANLALGLISLDAVEEWHPWFIDAWQTAAGRIVLAGSAFFHSALGLYAIASRRTLAFSVTDAAQWCLALLIPPLIVGHILALRVTSALAPEFDATYSYILAVYWSYAPHYALLQLVALVCIWTHGAIGAYSYFVLRPIWTRIGVFVTPLLFAVPILSLLGFVEAGKETLDRLDKIPAFRAAIEANRQRAVAVSGDIDRYMAYFLTAYGIIAAAALLILAARVVIGRNKTLAVAYDGGESARGKRGLSILDISRAGGIAHASVCAGRGRCGTCRVEILRGAESLSPMGEIERRTLANVEAPPSVRLACQARVLGEGVEVTRILPIFADASAARAPEEWVAGAEPAAGAAP